MLINNIIQSSDLLNYAISNGILDIETISQQIEMRKRDEILNKHPFKIWQGSNGIWYTYVINTTTQKRELKKRTSEEKLKDFLYQFYKGQEEEPTFHDVYHKWIEEKLTFNEIQKATYDRYQLNYRRFLLGTNLDKSKIKNIDGNILEKFIKTTIRDFNLSSKAYAGLRTLIIGTFKYAKREGLITFSISEFFGDLFISSNTFHRTVVKKEEQVFSSDEVDKIIEYLNDNPSIRNLGILLTFQTGMRVGELSTLKREDIDFKKHTIHIQRTEIRYRDKDTNKWTIDVREYPKSAAGDRYIIITEHAIATIKRIVSLNPFGCYLFEDEGRRIKEHGFAKRIARVCQILNIPLRSMHKIRKTYGTILIDNGVDERFVTDQMGHADIKSTKQYYYFSNKTDKEKLEQMRAAIPF